ncbi:hypothetical protein ACLMAB_09035 [Brevibacillus laterosporus]
MRQGSIIEQGSHQQLMDAKGEYYQTWERQSEWYNSELVYENRGHNTMSKKLVRDTGLEIGTTISQIHFTNWDSSKLELNFLPKGAALVFVSVFCSYCIDLLPHLRSISQRQNMQLYLFLMERLRIMQKWLIILNGNSPLFN